MVNKRIAKFRPGIAFTICTKQFLFPKKNNRERPETGIKDGFEEMEHEFPLGLFRSEKNRSTFSEVPLLPEIFSLERPSGLSGNVL